MADTDDRIAFERDSAASIEGEGNAVELTPGDTVPVGLAIDTTDADVDDLNTQLTINADTDVEGMSVQEPADPGRGNGGENTDGSTTDSQTESDSASDTNDDEQATEAAEDDEQSTLGQAWEATKALTLGFTLGNFGMPGGWHTAKESSSPLYLLGQLLNAIAPGGLDMVADLRDIVSDVSEGKFNWGTALNTVGLLPVLGNVDDVSDLRKITSNWMDAFPKKADEVVAFLSDALIKHLPGDSGANLLGALIDAPVQKLTKKKIPTEDIIKYQNKGVDFQKVINLRTKRVSAEDIRFYVDEGIDLGLVKRLRDEGMKPNRIRFRLGDGAKKSISTLRDQGYNRREIVRLIDTGADLKGASKLREQEFPKPAIRSFAEKGTDLKAAGKLGEKGFNKGEITTLIDEGADVKKISELRTQEIPKEGIKFYVDNGIVLDGVSRIREMGANPEQTWRLIEAARSISRLDKIPSEKGVKILNREISG